MEDSKGASAPITRPLNVIDAKEFDLTPEQTPAPVNGSYIEVSSLKVTFLSDRP